MGTLASDLFKRFATDSTKEEEGVWKDAGSGLQLLIGRTGNRNYQRMLAKAVETNKAVLDGKGDAADAMAESISIDTLARTCLLGWKLVDSTGVESAVQYNGADFPYTPDNAATLMQMRDLRELVIRFASDVQAYKMVQEAADEKN